HTVTLAASGREALERIAAALPAAGGEEEQLGELKSRSAIAFDVVITDRAMPDMSGDQVAAAVKRASPSTPVVMLTGFGDLMRGTEAPPPGVDAVLAKPATIADLRRVLAELAPAPGLDDAAG